MEASIILNQSEQKRLVVLNAVVAGQSTVVEAAASLGLSDRPGNVGTALGASTSH